MDEVGSLNKAPLLAYCASGRLQDDDGFM